MIITLRRDIPELDSIYCPYKALQLAGDADAARILESAYQLITTRASQITPPQDTVFLEAVGVNRAIVAA